MLSRAVENLVATSHFLPFYHFLLRHDFSRQEWYFWVFPTDEKGRIWPFFSKSSGKMNISMSSYNGHLRRTFVRNMGSNWWVLKSICCSAVLLKMEKPGQGKRMSKFKSKTFMMVWNDKIFPSFIFSRYLKLPKSPSRSCVRLLLKSFLRPWMRSQARGIDINCSWIRVFTTQILSKRKRAKRKWDWMNGFSRNLGSESALHSPWSYHNVRLRVGKSRSVARNASISLIWVKRALITSL